MRRKKYEISLYSSGYDSFDNHKANENSIFKTQSDIDEEYFSDNLPDQISIHINIEPILIEKDIFATLSINNKDLYSKSIYPNKGKYASGVNVLSNGRGFYLKDGYIKTFTKGLFDSYEIKTNKNILYTKKFKIQTTDFKYNCCPKDKLPLFQYAGLFSSDFGIEQICQIYGKLSAISDSTIVKVKNIDQWLTLGYKPSIITSSLAQDINDGKINLTLSKDSIDFHYKSITYQQIDKTSKNLIIHFAKEFMEV